MTSTFHGLNTAYRGLATQKGALNTVGHNVANASTPGYSRQRVNIQPTEPYPGIGMNRPDIPGQVGTGSEPGSIQRIREQFLDKQFRDETKKLGYWQSRSEAIYKMEEVMKESLDPKSDTGLSKVIDRFWQSLEDLHKNPANEGARSVVRQRAMAIGETFSYLSTSLDKIKVDIKEQLNVATDHINSLLKQVNDINRQIGEIEPHGYLPNDLYDRRDTLVDELSQYVDIEVARVKSSGNPKAVAEGKYTITLKGEDTVLINGDDYTHAKMNVNYNEAKEAVASITIIDAAGVERVTAAHNFKSQGRILGMVESYGYLNATGQAKGLYPEMLHELDVIAYNFATQFNAIHESGFTKDTAMQFNNGEIGFNAQGKLVDQTGAEVQTGVSFFNKLNKLDDAAKEIKVSGSIESSLGNIATAGSSHYPTQKIIEGNQAVYLNGSFLGYKNGTNEYTKLNINTITVPATGDPTVTATLVGKDATGNEVTQNITLTGTKFFGLTLDTAALNGQAFTKNYGAQPLGIQKTLLAVGDNSNALALANFKNKEFSFEGSTDATKKTIHGYYAGVVGELGVQGQEANRFFDSSKTLALNVEKNRQSVSGVSLEEEMTNMIRYSQAFNASARMLTTMDQMLDKIINSMGLVGR